MVRSKEEILSSLKSKLGEDVSDESLALMEDISDTLTDYDSRASEDWKKKYEDNDAAWRKRYSDRFSGIDSDRPDGVDTTDIEDAEGVKIYTYDQLVFGPK